MKQTVACFSSAVLGALLAVWLLDARPQTQVAAQDRRPTAPVETPTIRRRPVETNLFTPEGMTPDEAVNVAVYERVNKSVAHIMSKSSRPDGFFNLDVRTEGNGSGSVIDKAGHILTNYHVIENAREVSVSLYDGRSFNAEFVGADPINDVAIIKIDAPPNVLHPVEIGDSGILRVGMKVFAIGNPFGLERTMTTGIISSLNRSLQLRENRTIKSIIQIDAAVNPGNSGGPLLDSHGRLIGINTAIASNTGQSSGVGFAIPSNLVRRTVNQLLRHGRVIRPEIGIQQVFQTEQGLLIVRLTPNGPAERAGLRGPRVIQRRLGPLGVFKQTDHSVADLIVGVDDQAVATADDFLSHIEEKRPGDRILVKVIRDGQEITVPVVLGGDDPETNPRGTNI